MRPLPLSLSVFSLGVASAEQYGYCVLDSNRGGKKAGQVNRTWRDNRYRLIARYYHCIRLLPGNLIATTAPVRLILVQILLIAMTLLSVERPLLLPLAFKLCGKQRGYDGENDENSGSTTPGSWRVRIAFGLTFVELTERHHGACLLDGTARVCITIRY